MATQGGTDEPFSYRELDGAWESYVAKADPNEVPLVVAFISGLLHNPRTPGFSVPLEGISFPASFAGVPKTQAYVTWAVDLAKRELIVCRIESLNSLSRD